MRWYLVMLPFLSLFLFTGFKWQVYMQQIDTIDEISIHSIYSSIDMNKMINYDPENMLNDIKEQLVKYSVIELNYNIDYQISYKIIQYNPLILKVKLRSYTSNSTPEIEKMYILDTHL